MPNRKIELTWVCSSCKRENLGRHKICEGCGDPKDASEHFVMPGDTRAAASVTDPALLRAANAGVDWRCTFCRADNRALESVCKQCGAERGGTPGIARPARAPTALAPPSRAPVTSFALGVLVPLAIGVPCVIGALLMFAMRSSPAAPYVPPQPSILAAHVESRQWQTTRMAMRHRLVAQEGFAEQEPADAVDVTAAGARHHHDDQVEHGTEEQTYTEEVPYQDTETYTESMPCGQDCTTIPETCHEECSDDGNGFASCHDVCSGGGQTCTTRMCTQTGTRPITRTRTETRTRTVPHYDTVPRDAPWFTWRTWAWVEDRRADHAGTSEPPTWPSDEELGTGAPLGDGEEERIDSDANWSITLRDEHGGTETFRPAALEGLAAYPIGASVQVELDPYGSFSRVIDTPSDGGLQR